MVHTVPSFAADCPVTYVSPVAYFTHLPLRMPGAPVIQVGGQWKIRQTNGYLVDVNINQYGNTLDAVCFHSNHMFWSTVAQGFVRGEEFELTIMWNNGSKGKYYVRLVPGYFTWGNTGILKGSTVDINNPWNTAGWECDRVFTRL